MPVPEREHRPPVAVVTGAGSGIGVATAARLSADGFAVVAADIDDEAAARTAKQLALGSVASTVDVRDEEMVRELIALAEQIGRVEVLANVAGVGSTTAVTDTTVENWEAVMGSTREAFPLLHACDSRHGGTGAGVDRQRRVRRRAWWA